LADCKIFGFYIERKLIGKAGLHSGICKSPPETRRRSADKTIERVTADNRFHTLDLGGKEVMAAIITRAKV
jgi:hypothetical protein